MPRHRTAILAVLSLVLGIAGVTFLLGGDDADSVVATGCEQSGVHPVAGSLRAEFVDRSSVPGIERNDYRLSGTLRWESQAALECFRSTTIAWGFEHEIEFRGETPNRIANIDADFPDDSHFFVDTTANDVEGRTVLTVGLFRPDRLEAETTYEFAFDTTLPADPPGGSHAFTVHTEIAEHTCATPGSFCLEQNRERGRDRLAVIPTGHRFDVDAGGCVAWDEDGTESCGPTPTSVPVESADAASRDDTTPGPDPIDNDLDDAVPDIGVDAGDDPDDDDLDEDDLDETTTTSPTTTAAATTMPPAPTTTVASRPPPGTTIAPAPTSGPATTTTSPATTTTSSPTTTTTTTTTTTSTTTTTTSTTTTTTLPPPAEPVITSFSASGGEFEVRVQATISWPSGFDSGRCYTYVDGIIRETGRCDSSYTDRVKNVPAGERKISVVACTTTVVCAGSDTIVVTVFGDDDDDDAIAPD